jgi:Caspase domain
MTDDLPTGAHLLTPRGWYEHHLALVRRITGRASRWLAGAVLASALAGAVQAAAPVPGAPKSAELRRIAVVIGNARYPGIPLNNPENDARVVGQTLRGLGFEVTEHVNLPVRKFRQVLRDYVRTLQNTDVVGLLYYAGHGVQIDGRNYLLPVDINLRDQEEIKDEAVDIDDLFVSKLERAKMRGLIVILDACRDNPFRGKTRNIQAAGGLAEMGARGALIAYSAAPGATAEDGPEGSNSVFTRHLVREMLEQGVEVETMFKSVRVKVLRDTHKRQMPWVNSSLTVDFQFNPQVADARKEELRQQELARLQELLQRRDQQQRELEAQVKAMQREREQKPPSSKHTGKAMVQIATSPKAESAPKPELGKKTELERCVWCFPNGVGIPNPDSR